MCLTGSSQASMKLLGWSDRNPGVTPDGTATKKGEYQHVLFGRYPQSNDMGVSKTPILWKVLSSDQEGSSRKALLLSEKILAKMKYRSVDSNDYTLSDIRAFLTSSDQFYRSDYFTDIEKGVVIRNSAVMNDPIFLLSVSDLDEPAYGFKNGGNDVNRIAEGTSYAGTATKTWWTRTPFNVDYIAGHVNNAGRVNYVSVSATTSGIRPSCFLNLESVLFKTASNDFGSAITSNTEDGSQQNPYVLVLPGSIPTGAPDTWTMTFVPVNKHPNKMEVSGDVITLSWAVPISPAVKKWPASEDFTLMPSGVHPLSVTSDDANPKLLKLTFANGATSDKNITLSYNLNTDAIKCDVFAGTSSVANSFSNISVTLTPPSTPNVSPTQARFDGSSPEDLKALLSGSALSAANAGTLNLVAETSDGTRTPLNVGDYSIEARNLTFFKTFLSKLGDGTHTIYLYRDNVQLGKITLIVTGNNERGTEDSGSNGCNAGFDSAGLLGMGILLLSLNKAGARKKK